MLHPVNLPDCLEHLWGIVFIQEQLLDISLEDDPTNPRILRQHFDPDTVDWLWKYKPKLLDPLAVFANHPDQAQKEQVVCAFRHDIDYQNHLQDVPAFVFQLQPKQQLPAPIAIDVGKWLASFYDVMSKKGIPPEVSGYESTINSQLILEEFDTVNLETRVCPVCDGSWMRRTSTGRSGSTIDHFLPRSKYPALSVHPFNLLPICSICNDPVKEDKDPLYDNQPRSTTDAYICCAACRPPRPGRDRLTLRVAPNTPHPWELNGYGMSPAQISLFPDVFDIPGQWKANQDQVDRLVQSRLRAWMRSQSAASGSVSRNRFHSLLYDLEQSLQREWGELENLYPATWWLRWLHANRFEDLVREFL